MLSIKLLQIDAKLASTLHRIGIEKIHVHNVFCSCWNNKTTKKLENRNERETEFKQSLTIAHLYLQIYMVYVVAILC